MGLISNLNDVDFNLKYLENILVSMSFDNVDIAVQ